mmetsp:Transcript_36028/g.100687  ORF Transcript_36028/g.100687 Transcript_36028/m.100687 type:complete len:387 (+) Transcript_36028:171-1331(+)
MENISVEKQNKDFVGHQEQNSIDDETEDEEVKLNCIGGLRRGYQDSDFSSDSGEEDDMEEEKKSEDGVVEFSCRTTQETNPGVLIVRPKPERLSPHQEEASAADDSSGESSAASSVGARGAALSLGDNADEDSASDEEIIADDESIGDEVDGSSYGEESDNEQQNLTEEPPILPQQSILHEIQLVEKKFEAIGSQTSLNKVEPKAKRVLSSNTLSALNAEAGRNADTPKRMRTAPESFLKSIDSLPELSLGISAMDAIRPLSNRYSTRDDESQAISSDDDEELDRALSEELKRPSKMGGENSPVPLLTPPQSPLTIPNEGCDLVEWPSNLVVDSAMMSAASITRTLSAPSLQKLEEDEEVRLKDAYSYPEPSSLTPLLRSIYVGIE